MGAFFLVYLKSSQPNVSHMRLIERQMNQAIRSGSDFRKDNTEVVNINGNAFVYLHGNHIATVFNDSMQIFDGGWRSNTTKSRLNALCYEFAYGCGVFQKNFEWFISTACGTVDFDSGYFLPLGT